jgi:hypothetical protein
MKDQGSLRTEEPGGWPTLNHRSILPLILRVAHPSDFASEGYYFEEDGVCKWAKPRVGEAALRNGFTHLRSSVRIANHRVSSSTKVT